MVWRGELVVVECGVELVVVVCGVVLVVVVCGVELVVEVCGVVVLLCGAMSWCCVRDSVVEFWVVG